LAESRELESQARRLALFSKQARRPRRLTLLELAEG